MPGTMPCRLPDSLVGVPDQPREPLWASSLKDQPRHDDVTVQGEQLLEARETEAQVVLVDLDGAHPEIVRPIG